MLLSRGSMGAGCARPRAIIALLNRPSRSRNAVTLTAESRIALPLDRPGPWVIARGWGARIRVFEDGRRQIFNFLIPGDSFTMPPQGAKNAGVVALTSMQVVPVEDITDDLGPGAGGVCLAAACRLAAKEEVNLVLDHVMRLGQQTATERTAHLLLELAGRLAAVHMADDHVFIMPIKQECLAQALGMSAVHLNRTLHKLKADGLIAMHGARVTLLQPGRLKRLCSYGEVEDFRHAAKTSQALAS